MIEDHADIILDDINEHEKYDASIVIIFVNILRKKENQNDLMNKIMPKFT